MSEVNNNNCNHDCANCDSNCESRECEANSSGCNHDCANCSSHCESREIVKETPNQYTKIGKMIAVVSGKGGVGKSTVTSLIAKDLVKKGYKVGILDADITGPSIPMIFDCQYPAYGEDNLMLPNVSNEGIKIVSANMLLEDPETPVIWRGPILAGMVKQFYTDVKWGELDYLLVDCPPGTGDVPLTVFQSLPIDQAVIVTTPQELVSMIVMKAVNMLHMMNVEILGVVENMSYITCPDCNKQIDIFGLSSLDTYQEKGLVALDRLPIDQKVTGQIKDGEFSKTDLTVPLTIKAIEG